MEFIYLLIFLIIAAAIGIYYGIHLLYRIQDKYGEV